MTLRSAGLTNLRVEVVPPHCTSTACNLSAPDSFPLEHTASELTPYSCHLRDCEGKHEFDAVSANGKIVAEIKTASGRTSGGKHPSGKRASAFEQLYFLSLVEAEKKLLIITDAEFLEIMKARTAGIVPADIELVKCPLPPHLAAIVHSITNEASKEIDRGKKSF